MIKKWALGWVKGEILRRAGELRLDEREKATLTHHGFSEQEIARTEAASRLVLPSILGRVLKF